MKLFFRIWETLPDLNHPRESHGCGVVYLQGKRVFMVAGGYNRTALNPTVYDGMYTIEILDLGTTSNMAQWEVVPVTLPSKVRGRRIANIGAEGEVALVDYGQVLFLHPTELTWRVVVGGTGGKVVLSVARAWFFPECFQ